MIAALADDNCLDACGHSLDAFCLLKTFHIYEMICDKYSFIGLYYLNMCRQSM